MLRKASLLLSALLAVVQVPLFASPVINTEDHPAARIEMNELVPDHPATKQEIKTLKKNEKQLLHFETILKKINKAHASGNAHHAAGLFNDPVNKWFWLWLLTWGAGILLLVVSSGGVSSPAIGILWLLAFAIGSVSLIIWLIKKFG